MIIGIDIDDTLSLLQPLKIELANKYIKENNMPYKLIKPNANFFSEMYDWPADVCDKFWDLIGDYLLDTVNAREHASEIISKLRNNGHKIIIITARSSDWHKDPYGMSVDWLNRYKIPFDKLIVGKSDKIPVCLEEKIDLFIDDLPSTLIRLNNVGIDTVMMISPSNQDQTEYKGKKAQNWLEVEKHINNKLKNIENYR